jgi:hypothetical protein
MVVVDTTDTQVGGVTPGIGPTGPLAIMSIKWVATQNSGKDIAQNDDLGIKFNNASGSYIIECRAQDSTPHQLAYSVDFPKCWIVPGLYVEDLDGGELQLFLE